MLKHFQIMYSSDSDHMNKTVFLLDCKVTWNHWWKRYGST